MNLPLVTAHFTPKFVLDIGARCGDWANNARHEWPDVNLLLVEGNPECEETLKKSGYRYKIALLSDSEKGVDFYTSRDLPMSTGCSYYIEKTGYFDGEKGVILKLKTTTLDKLCEHLLFPKPLLIKVDTQGSELDILQGGSKTLEKADAVILELSRTEFNIGAPLCDVVNDWMDTNGWKVSAVLSDSVTGIGAIQNDVLYLRK